MLVINWQRHSEICEFELALGSSLSLIFMGISVRCRISCSAEWERGERTGGVCISSTLLHLLVVHCLQVILLGNPQNLISKPLHFVFRETEAREWSNESKFTYWSYWQTSWLIKKDLWSTSCLTEYTWIIFVNAVRRDGGHLGVHSCFVTFLSLGVTWLLLVSVQGQGAHCLLRHFMLFFNVSNYYRSLIWGAIILSYNFLLQDPCLTIFIPWSIRSFKHMCWAPSML